MGGSTTSLLALLNCLDKEKYEIDLQLYREKGELFDLIPDAVNVLPFAIRFNKTIRKPLQILIGVFKGYFFKAFYINRKNKRIGFSQQVLSDFQVKESSKFNTKHYDYAIGFLEGWSDRYLAYKVNADKKYAWIHSTFENIAPVPELEFNWMEKVDKIAFVSDQCTVDFKDRFPRFAKKTLTVENILDSSIIHKRSEMIDNNDACYTSFSNFEGTKIITVCRIDINIKGLDRALVCAKTLKSKNLKFMWVIVGGGAQLTQFRERIKETDLSDCVYAIGERTNPYAFMKCADVYCMLSRYEGKPMTVTESKILGIPVVVTEYLSARAQVKNGLEGIVVENSDNSAAPILQAFIENPEKILEMKKYLMAQEYGNCEYINYIEEILLDGAK